MATVESLLSDFHNLQGETLQEKNKVFQQFLSTIKEKLQNTINEDKFITELKPTSDLEHLFRIDLLSHLKRNNELLEVLKSGNREHIGKILKNLNFFAEIIPTINAQILVDDIFPHTSYVIKVKLINRIYKTVKNEQLLDEYFWAIEEKYGLRMAFALLPGCSIKLIKLKVNKYKPQLTGRHLIAIYKKDSTFLFYYFDIRMKQCCFKIEEEYPSVIKYISKKDPELFWKLQKEFKFDFKSGKHLSKKLIKHNIDVLKHGEKCTLWFKTSTLVKIINQEGKMDEFLLSFYPDTPMEFLRAHMDSISDINKILTLLSPEKRYSFIQQLFYKKYSMNILNYQMLFSQHFLELMPLDARESIVTKHLEINDEYVYLLSADKSIPLLKTSLQNSSKAEHRSKILGELCKTLRLNENKATLLDTIKFMYDRYRNDTRSLRIFIKDISEWKNLEDIGTEHLKLLYNLAFYTKEGYSSRLPIETISNAYLYHLIKNNMDFDNHLMEHLKTVAADDYYYLDIFPYGFKHQKVILERIIDIIDYFKDNDEAYTKLTAALIMQIFEYNKEHKKKFEIPLNRYKHLLKQSLEKKSYNFHLALCYCIKNYKDADLFKYFWLQDNADVIWNMLPWFLKYDIKQIDEHIDSILSNHFGRPSQYVLRAIKKYMTADMRKKTVAYIESQLSFDNIANSVFLVTLLPYVDSGEFLKVTTPFMPPENGKLDALDGKNIGLKKELQAAVIHSLSNVETKNLLDNVKKVCVGDYLKYGLNPLYKLLYNMKEIDLPAVLNDLKQSPVSLAKHGLLLSRHLLPTKEALKFIEKALENERNVSVKNIIFKKALHLFLEMQTDETWNQLCNYFEIVNSDDVAILDFMINYVRKIPSRYIAEYIQRTFEVLKNTKSKEFCKKIVWLTESIPTNIVNNISYTLMKEIVGITLKEIFLRAGNEDCFWKFALHLDYSKSQDLVRYAIGEVKIHTVDMAGEPGYVKHRVALNTFLYSFCKNVLKEHNIEHKQIIDVFNQYWNIIPKHCLMDNIMLLKLTAAYYQSEFDLKKFALLLNKLLHEYINEYDATVIYKFRSRLTEICESCGLTDDNLFDLANAIVTCNYHKFNYIFTVMLLPKTMFPSEDNINYKWVAIIKLIEEYIQKGDNVTSVMFHYDNYLQDHHNEYIWTGDQPLSIP